MGCVNSVAQGVIRRGDRRAGLDVSFFFDLCCSRPEDRSGLFVCLFVCLYVCLFVCLFVVGVVSDGR
jgi:hypothetical protein